MKQKKGFVVGEMPGAKIWTVLFFVYLYAPMIILIVYSFNANRRVMNWTGFSFDWYIKAFANDNIQRAAWNSLIIALVATAFAVTIATLAALILGRRNRSTTGHDERHHRAYGVLYPVRVSAHSCTARGYGRHAGAGFT